MGLRVVLSLYMAVLIRDNFLSSCLMGLTGDNFIVFFGQILNNQPQDDCNSSQTASKTDGDFFGSLFAKLNRIGLHFINLPRLSSIGSMCIVVLLGILNYSLLCCLGCQITVQLNRTGGEVSSTKLLLIY